MASGPTTEPLPPSDQSENSTSNSEQYDGNTEQFSSSNPSAHQPALILYTPPTVWGLVRGAAINVLLPFVNGLMLGFGELFAHELAFRLGWSGTKVWLPSRFTITPHDHIS